MSENSGLEKNIELFFRAIFLKLAFFDENMYSTFSPRPVCQWILITLQDDSLESVVDACLF